MKIYGFALLAAFASSAVSAKTEVAIRGTEDKQIAENARKLAEDAKEFHRNLMGMGESEYDGGAGCNCAKDAVKYISHAHADALQVVPMTTMAMLEKHKDEIWDVDDGHYEPLVYYKHVVDIVEDIVIWANCVLLQIDCGLCIGDGSHGSDDSRRELMGGTTPYDGISNFECCCNVNAIKKLVIDHINDFFLKAMLNPGGADFVKMNLETLFDGLISAVKYLAEPFEDMFEYDCDEPEFPDLHTLFDTSRK